MTNSVHRGGARSGLPVVLAISALLAACGPFRYEVGVPFDPAAITRLQPGSGSEADVRNALGEPFGKGQAMMPYQDSTRQAWNYLYERGSIDVATGALEDRTRYMFVFFRDDRLDGYLWFDTLTK